MAGNGGGVLVAVGSVKWSASLNAGIQLIEGWDVLGASLPPPDNPS